MMWLNHGGLGVSSLTGYISPDYKAFWISPRFHPRYVHHLLRSPRYVDYFGAIGTGVRPERPAGHEDCARHDAPAAASLG